MADPAVAFRGIIEYTYDQYIIADSWKCIIEPEIPNCVFSPWKYCDTVARLLIIDFNHSHNIIHVVSFVVLNAENNSRRLQGAWIVRLHTLKYIIFTNPRESSIIMRKVF